MDGDEVFDEALEQQWEHMKLSGYTEEQITQAKQRKKFKEDAFLYDYMVKTHAWESDLSCDRIETNLKLAFALDAINRRSDAIESLQNAIEDEPFDSRLNMAVAKLLFRDDQKEKSLAYCKLVFDTYTKDQQDQHNKNTIYVSVKDALNAYYLAGWIKIHDDNHTAAYELWSQGHRAIPSCLVLKKQHNKRECWDQNPMHLKEWMQQVVGLLGDASKDDTGAENFNSERDLESYYLPIGVTVPPLSLFSSLTQQRRLVFRTKEALMTAGECSAVLEIVRKHHEKYQDGVWGTVRHSSVKTTDVAVEDIISLRPWLLALLHTRIYPLLHTAFPVLADGSSLIDPNTTNSRIRVHDAFIVRYDAINDKSTSLPEHCDTSAISIIFALNERDNGNGDFNNGDYKGGGTWFECLGPKGLVVNADIGHAVIFAGPLKHAGFPISDGVRHVLVLFLYVEGFHYGPYLKRDDKEVEPKEDPQTVEIRPSGAEEGGFVVYRQTVELVSMLEESTS